MPRPEARPVVSVIIPTRKRPDQLKEALASIYAQQGLGERFEIEVIVVYNSTDDVPSDIRSQYPECVYCQELKLGAAVARNAGIRRASGKYVAFLDDDDLWLPDKLSSQVPVLEDRPEIGVVYGQMRITEGDRVSVDAWPESAPSGEVFKEFLVRTDDFVHTDTLLVRREILDRAGHFNNNFNGMEQYDFFLRLAFHTQWRFLQGVVGVGRFSRDGLWFTAVVNGTNERVLPQIVEQALALLPPTAEYESLRRDARSAVCATIAGQRWWNGGPDRVREHLLATLQTYPWMLEVPPVADHISRVALELARAPVRPIANVRTFWTEIKATRPEHGLMERLRMRQLLGNLLMHAAIGLQHDSPRRAAVAAVSAVLNDPSQLRRTASLTIPIAGILGVVVPRIKRAPPKRSYT